MKIPTVTCAPWNPVSTKNALLAGLLPSLNPSSTNVRELVDLAADENDSEHRGCNQPDALPTKVAALDGGQGQNHRETRHQKDERADRRVGDVVDLVRLRTGALENARAIQQVRRYERAEEQTLGAQEGPHGHLGVVETGARVVVIDVGVAGLAGDFRYGAQWSSSADGLERPAKEPDDRR